MSQSADDIIDAVEQSTELDRDEVEDRVESELEELKANQSSAMPEEELRKHAASIVKNDVKNITGGGGFGGGETEEVPVLALGYQRKEADYFVTDGDALLALGIVNPDDDPAGVAMFLIDEDHGVDLDYAAEAFQPLNTVRAFASRRQVGSMDNEPAIRKGGKPTYLLNSTGQSKFEQVNPEDVDDADPISELPGDREAKREMIHEHFITEEDKVTLQTYAEHETATRPSNNGREYEVAFGIDVKRFRGEVVDLYSNDDGFGTMTLMDDSAFDESDVPEELISDRMRVPGLQVLMEPDLMDYGENSILDVYGFVQQTQEGQYRMQGLGVVPIVEFEREEYGGGGGSDDDDIDEDTI